MGGSRVLDGGLEFVALELGGLGCWGDIYVTLLSAVSFVRSLKNLNWHRRNVVEFSAIPNLN